jgi:hypothetical protein
MCNVALGRTRRDAPDVLATIKSLAMLSIEVIVLQLGKLDLASSAGKLALAMLAAVAEMERDLLVERAQAGLQRAGAEGKVFRRPRETNQEQRAAMIDAAPARQQHQRLGAAVCGIHGDCAGDRNGEVAKGMRSRDHLGRVSGRKGIMRAELGVAPTARCLTRSGRAESHPTLVPQHDEVARREAASSMFSQRPKR